jgi:beta-lactamase regulating signal transducer with metallopeptidase domain
MMHHVIWNEAWTAALINHLWQSTLFVLIAWAIALVLRKNHARTRYWIWMIASVKFLIPFSILINAGEFLRALFAARIQSPALTAAMEQIAQPFPPASSAAILIFNDKTSSIASSPAGALSWILAAIWLSGFLVFVILWARKWIGIRRAVRASTHAGFLGATAILISNQWLEPAVFGIFRPVLLLPEAIREHLAESQLNTIVAHEMCHIRRRDNLSTAIHMTVQALFWFHPAMWWIKARLMDERERACDEAVL